MNWGIGRELYTSPPIKVKCEVEEYNSKKNVKNLSNFTVTHIKIENKNISELSITAWNKSAKKNQTIFEFKNERVVKRDKENAVEYKCSVCGKVITQAYYENSIAKYGVALCSKQCLEKHKAEKQ